MNSLLKELDIPLQWFLSFIYNLRNESKHQSDNYSAQVILYTLVKVLGQKISFDDVRVRCVTRLYKTDIF